MATIPQTQLDQLNAFVLVAQHGSFTAAADTLNRDSSVITRRIAALERRLGVRLFERTTRRMSLTEAGAAYLQRVRGALEELALADAEAASRSQIPHGVLKLALPLAYGRMWIAPRLPDFLAKYPEVRIEARLSDRFVDLVAEGQDLAVRLGALPDSTLVARKIVDFERGLYASPGYLQRWGPVRSPRELTGHRGLGFLRYEQPGRWQLRWGDKRETVSVPTLLLSDEVESLVMAAEADVGIVIAAEWLVSKQLSARRLIRVLPQWRVGEPSAVYAVTPSGRLLPSKTKVFLDWVIDVLRRASQARA